MQELPTQTSMKLNKPITRTQKLVIGAIAIPMALLSLVILIIPANNVDDTRNEKWMSVMELTDEQIANTAEINTCNTTISTKTARNEEIAKQKEQIKDEVFAFGEGTR